MDESGTGSRHGRPAGPPPPTPYRPAGPPPPTPAADTAPRTPSRGTGGSTAAHEASSDDDSIATMRTPSPDPFLSRSSSSEREPRRRRTRSTLGSRRMRTRTRSARAKAASSTPTPKAKAKAAPPAPPPTAAPPVPPPVGPQSVDLQFFYDDYREYRRWAVIEQNNLRDTVDMVAWMICSPEERCKD